MADALLDSAAALGIQPRTNFFDTGPSQDIISRYAGSAGVNAAATQLARTAIEFDEDRHRRLAEARQEEVFGRQRREEAEADQSKLQRGQFLHEFSKLGDLVGTPEYDKTRNELIATLPEAAHRDDGLQAMLHYSDTEHQKRLQAADREKYHDDYGKEVLSKHYIENVAPYLPQEQQPKLAELLANSGKMNVRELGAALIPYSQEARKGKAADYAQRVGVRTRAKLSEFQAKQDEAEAKVIEETAHRLGGAIGPEEHGLIVDEEGLPTLREQYEKAKKKAVSLGLEFDDSDLAGVDKKEFVQRVVGPPPDKTDDEKTKRKNLAQASAAEAAFTFHAAIGANKTLTRLRKQSAEAKKRMIEETYAEERLPPPETGADSRASVPAKTEQHIPGSEWIKSLPKN